MASILRVPPMPSVQWPGISPATWMTTVGPEGAMQWTAGAPAPAVTVVRRKGGPAPVAFAPPAAPVALAAPAPPGWFDPRVQAVQATVGHVPRRFPGHFMPHRLCNHFTAHGWCRKAEACTFAHGMQELHPDVQAQLLPQLGYPVPQPIVQVKGKAKDKGKGSQPGSVIMTAAPQYISLGDPALGYPMTGSDLNAGAAVFEFGTHPSHFEFNVGAAPFVPLVEADQQDEQDQEEQHQQQAQGAHNGDHDADPSSPSRRRPAPAPLNLDDSPMVASSAMPGTMVVVTPQAVMRTVQPGVGRVVSTVIRPTILTPTATMMSPSRNLVTMTLTSPTAARLLQSPARGPVVFRSPAVVWPSSPLLLSPKVAPSTPVPISRNIFLQARTVAQRLELGPPGLAHCAPTPTTKAGNFGFRYPQPGWLVAKPLR